MMAIIKNERLNNFGKLKGFSGLIKSSNIVERGLKIMIIRIVMASKWWICRKSLSHQIKNAMMIYVPIWYIGSIHNPIIGNRLVVQDNNGNRKTNKIERVAQKTIWWFIPFRLFISAENSLALKNSIREFFMSFQGSNNKTNKGSWKQLYSLRRWARKDSNHRPNDIRLDPYPIINYGRLNEIFFKMDTSTEFLT